MPGHGRDGIAADQIPGSSAADVSHERAREQAGSHGVSEKDQDTHINEMELLGLLAVVWTLGPEVLTGRDVLMFCDNTAAMSATVHVYARSPNLAAFSNTLHLALATLRCNLWVEWVPSDANCADVPSRPQGPEALLFYEKLGCKQWQGGIRNSLQSPQAARAASWPWTWVPGDMGLDRTSPRPRLTCSIWLRNSRP